MQPSKPRGVEATSSSRVEVHMVLIATTAAEVDAEHAGPMLETMDIVRDYNGNYYGNSGNVVPFNPSNQQANMACMNDELSLIHI